MSSLLEGTSVGSLTPRRGSRVSIGSLESSSLGSNLFVGQKSIETEKTDPNRLKVPKTPRKLTKKITKKFSMWSDNFETNLVNRTLVDILWSRGIAAFHDYLLQKIYLISPDLKKISSWECDCNYLE